jgi:soluble lytic murein transglycosylase
MLFWSAKKYDVKNQILGGRLLMPKRRDHFSTILWVSILIFMVMVLSFPKWITVFYPLPHQELVFIEAGEHNVDPYLVFAIIRAESKYQSSAESSVGAKGLMQIMPETGTWIAEQNGIEGFKAADLHQPKVNISFGCWYLHSLSQEFNDNIPLTVASYNAGRGKVQEWLVGGTWNGDPEQIDKIPFPETRQYLKNVLKNYEAYKAIYE